MRRRWHGWRRAVPTIGALACASCSTHGLSLVQDERVDIVAPDDRAEVALPVIVEWDVGEFDVGEGAGSFGVVVDRAPPPPGRTLEWLFRNADDCAGIAGCPDPAYLAQRSVHRTTETSFTVERVAADRSGERRRFHEVTVILLDERGARVGEGAWSVQFAVEDDDR